MIAAIWAGAFIGIKIAVPVVGPVGVAALRAAIGFAVLLPFGLLARMPPPGSYRDWAVLVALAQLNITVPFFLISWAELTVDASVASLVMGIGPLFAMVGAHYFNDGDELSPIRIVGALVGLAGVAVLIGGEAIAGVGSSSFAAVGALITASMCYVVSGLLVRRLDLPALPMSIYALGIAAITLVPAFVALTPTPPELDPRTLLAILYLGLIPTGLAYLLRFYLIRTVGYATFAVSINLIPVFGVLFGVAILGEALTPRILVALAFVVCGLVLARKRGPVS